MTIRGTAFALVILLSVLGMLWMGWPGIQHSASGQESWRVTGWMIVDFKGDPDTEWRILWRDGSTRRWAKNGCKYAGARPNAAILQISRTFYSQAFKIPDTLQHWDAFALVGAATLTDLQNVERYVEACYSHVDLYRFDETITR